MDIALALLIALLVLSSAFSLILIYKYLAVTRKRREFIAALGGSGRAVPRFKHTLMTIYGVSTFLWTLVLLIYFFIIRM